MEVSGKVPESDFTGDVKRELHAWPELLDDDCGVDFTPEVPINEELVEEVMQELWKEITNPPSTPTGFLANPQPFFVAVGDQESIGPSFSNSSSTVMAGIEMGGVSVMGGGVWRSVGPTRKCDCEAAAAGDGPWLVVEGRESCDGGGGCGCGCGEIMGEKMDGCDDLEADDEWLTRVLSWAPQEIDEWL